MELTLEDIHAYAEVDYIINHMNIKYKEMIPEKLLRFFSEYKQPNLDIKINPYIPLQNQGLSKYTLEIIALLHLKYWCEDEARKQELYNIILENQKKLNGQVKNRFDIESLFPDAENLKENSDEMDLSHDADYSRPKEIAKFEQFSENVEETENIDYAPNYNTQENIQEKNLTVENRAKVDIGIFNKIKEFFLSIFGTKK